MSTYIPEFIPGDRCRVMNTSTAQGRGIQNRCGTIVSRWGAVSYMVLLNNRQKPILIHLSILNHVTSE